MDYIDNLDKIDIYILIGAFLCPIFVILAKIKNGKNRRQGNIKKWPYVGGRVKSSGVKDQIFKGAQRSWKSWKDVKAYTPYVVYEYSYNGKKYTGIDISPIKTISSNLSDSKKVLKKYPAGKLVDVYVNPSKHSEAYLEPVNIEMYLKLADLTFSIFVPLLAVVVVFLKH